jgi:DNA-3-methyladenine glycosylase II
LAINPPLAIQISGNRSRLWGCWRLKSSEEPALTLSADQLREALDHLADRENAFSEAILRVGYPPPRIRPRGYETLLRTIIGQQVSVQSANAIWNRLEAAGGTDPARLVDLSDDELRAVGLSRQKSSYARSLAEAVASGHLDLSALPKDDEDAIAQLIAVRGIGRWSAEIYLLFAEGRADIWPAGDLAVQIECGHILGLESRPSERATRALAEAWRPHRGAAAIFAWHHYGARLRARTDKAPV